MTESRKKVLHYRKAQFLHSKATLQTLLSAALNSMKLVSDREEDLSGNGTFFRLVNTPSSSLGMEFGDVVTYETGTNKLLLKMSKNVASLDVRQLQPPLVDQTKTEFLDGHLFYGVQGNHVVILQSSLRIRELENHLNYLLRRAGVIKNNDQLELADAPPAETKKRVANAPVKSVSIGAPVLDVQDVQLDDAAPKSKQKNEMVRVAKEGMGAKIIQAILGEDEFNKLKLDRAIDGNLKVALEISYSRTTSDKGQSVLNSIARVFRHVDAEDYAVVIPGVGRLKGQDLKITDSVTVETVGGVVNLNDLFPQMHRWLLSLLERNIIGP